MDTSSSPSSLSTIRTGEFNLFDDKKFRSLKDPQDQNYNVSFFFILVYFSAHSFIIVNISRQLKHDAGGFSYKSTRTLLELFPLIILVVNVKLNTHKNINHDTVTNSKIWLTKRGIPSTIQTSQPP